VFLSGRNQLSIKQVLGYWGVQVLAGILGAFVGRGLTGKDFDPAPGAGFTIAQAFFSETVYTFALASVVLNVATTKSQSGNSFFGLAIGFTVLAGILTVGPISGAIFNPAVGTGPTFVHGAMHKGSWKHLWIYWLAPLLGSSIASLFFRVTNRKEYRNDTDTRPYSEIADTV